MTDGQSAADVVMMNTCEGTYPPGWGWSWTRPNLRYRGQTSCVFRVDEEMRRKTGRHGDERRDDGRKVPTENPEKMCQIKRGSSRSKQRNGTVNRRPLSKTY